MMRSAFVTSVALVIFLSGCAGTNFSQRYYGNENSPYFRVPIDSTLVLNQELTVPAQRNRVFFQYRQALANFYDVDEYQPWCVLRLDVKRDTTHTITPDAFAVHRVGREYLYQVALAGPIQVAQLEDGKSFVYQVVGFIMGLQSKHQPDVLNLSCTRWGVPQGRYWVRIRDIRETLGDIFTLQLATTGAEAKPTIHRKSEGSSY